MADAIERLHGPPDPLVVDLPRRWEWLRRRLAAADPSPPEWFALQFVVVAGPVAGVTAAYVVHWFVGLALAGSGPVVPAVALVRWRNRRNDRLMEELPPTLELLARLLRTGLTPSQAVTSAASRATGPMAERLETIVLGLRLGAEPQRVTARLCQPGDPRALARTAVVLGFALHEGAGAAEALDGLARSLRRDQAVQRQAVMLTAQARLSARVLSALPVVFVAAGLVTGNEQTRALATTSIGRASAVAGVVLLAMGFGWMHVLIARIDR